MNTYYRRNNQPHIQTIAATFSVTLMAHDAIPLIKLDTLRNERNAALGQLSEKQIPS